MLPPLDGNGTTDWIGCTDLDAGPGVGQVAVDLRLDAEEAGEGDERRHELCVDGWRRR